MTQQIITSQPDILGKDKGHLGIQFTQTQHRKGKMILMAMAGKYIDMLAAVQYR